MAANTIRYTGGAGATAPGATVFSANGLINAGSGAWTIGASAVTIGADRELVINAANSGITFTGIIQDNSPGVTSGVTICGNTGAVTLNSGSTYTGATTINGGTLVVTALRNAGTASELGTGASLALNNAMLQTGATDTSDRSVTLTGTSGFYVKGAFKQTLTGSISGSGNLSVKGDFNGGTPGGTGNLVLAGDNSFSGDVVFQPDSHLTLANVNALKQATLNMTGARILADLNTNNLDYVIGALMGSVGLDIGSGNVSIGNNGRSTTYSGALSGAGSVTKIGGGTLTLSGTNQYNGATTVTAGTLAVSISGKIGNGNVSLNGGTLETVGAQTLGPLAQLLATATSGNTLKFDSSAASITLSSSKGYDFSKAIGGLALDLSNQFNVDGTYNLLTGASPFIETDASFYTFINADTANHSFSFSSGVLTVQAVPEPGAAMGLIGGAAMLLGLRRRRVTR
jgi:autotransporter-associated beta strand protein